MRAVVQRVSSSSVSVDGETVGKIGAGFNVLLGVEKSDGENDADYIIKKLTGLRIFSDENDKLNLSIGDIGGEILLISQFTLCGDAREGRRPSFTNAMSFNDGERLFNLVADGLRKNGIKTETGVYGADMLVSINNDGPVTILLDSKKLF